MDWWQQQHISDIISALCFSTFFFLPFPAVILSMSPNFVVQKPQGHFYLEQNVNATRPLRRGFA
jgi:hypothetical protein